MRSVRVPVTRDSVCAGALLVNAATKRGGSVVLLVAAMSMTACSSILGIHDIEPPAERDTNAGPGEDATISADGAGNLDGALTRDDRNATDGVGETSAVNPSDSGNDAANDSGPQADASDAGFIPDSGVQCANACTINQTACNFGGVQTCETQANGCTQWVTTSTCGANQTCTVTGVGAASCTCEATQCSEVGTVCQGTQTVVTCEKDANGCFYAASTSTCPMPQFCSGTAPSAACSSSDGGSSTPPTGLLYYFALAGDTNDYSGNGNNAINSGATPTTGHSGKANSAYLFNGTSNYMTVPGSRLPIANAARTFSMWVKPTTTTLNSEITLWGQGDCVNGGGNMFGLGSRPNEVFYGGCDSAGGAAGIPVGSWTFLAAVFTPPNQMRVFINGTGTTYSLATNLNTQPSALWIGGETVTNSASNIRSYFSGSIDSIRIYDHALSDAEVATIMALP
jgi:hypothetical protein